MSTRVLNELRKNGYIKIKNFFSQKQIKNIQNEFFSLSKKLYKQHYNKGFEKNINDDFDSYCIESFKKKNDFSSRFYETCKKLNSFHEIFYEKKTKNLLKKIFKKKSYGILNRGYGFRFDYPNDKKFLTQLHQDYTSNLGSPIGYVFITPLKNITKNMGPIRVYPGSHKAGIRNIKVIKNKNIRITRSFEIEVKKKDLLKNSKTITLNTGDLLVIDFLTLHESTQNFSKKIRFTMIYRFIDYDNQISINNFVPNGEQDGNYFDQFHKEKIKK
jgi:ectoine hydroxylase-related dioxygenase (phytanoyl-CoA dioxygenase family)